ncbi:leucine-rich repeat-containing G-protein coupled receptor 6 isoform X2 [Camelus ferus]|uniref:Leucine-rich repeat-containing G-protein coupled receptor 6 isoform X2 n=1 Tax=Camelus ferus TaxID=419612 RepID=A0A8B8RZB4_CAMFR|nr:leucine-rich repeat-containing G-protein coupled receptor 6 isoform X2 [Camelus ferus]
MPSPAGLRALWLCAALCACPCARGAPQPGPRPACPAPCRCQRGGITLSADCSERGLSAVPRDLDPLTAYLDLSMNNLTELQPGLFHHLRFLEELRLSGNHLSHIPGQAFAGLYSLKTLMLQNNRLGGVPAEALWELPSLQSLRLDANLISLVPDGSFRGLPSLRHLWLDDNALTEIPVRALSHLPGLQAMTLALNRIAHVPDRAFQNLSSLVVLHLHNNRIEHLGTHSFEGLHSLETLLLSGGRAAPALPLARACTHGHPAAAPHAGGCASPSSTCRAALPWHGDTHGNVASVTTSALEARPPGPHPESTSVSRVGRSRRPPLSARAPPSAPRWATSEAEEEVKPAHRSPLSKRAEQGKVAAGPGQSGRVALPRSRTSMQAAGRLCRGATAPGEALGTALPLPEAFATSPNLPGRQGGLCPVTTPPFCAAPRKTQHQRWAGPACEVLAPTLSRGEQTQRCGVRCPSFYSLYVTVNHQNTNLRLPGAQIDCRTSQVSGLRSERRDLNYNELWEFPVAIRTLGRLQELGFHDNNIRAIPEEAFLGNPLLQTIHFYDNPIQFVGRSAFRYLPRLHTLSLNGATNIQEFPDLKGTTSLEILTLTRAGIQQLPPGVCQQLPRLRVLELSHNQIQELPSLRGCRRLEEVGLRHNRLWEIGADTFSQLTSLRALDLSWNAIRSIHPEAFATLRSLVKLDLTDNQLTTLPLAGLGGLVHLKLKGNPALSQAFSKDSFPKLRTLEVPYAYQCCTYGVCASVKASEQWEPQDFQPEDWEAPKRPLGLLDGRPESHYDLDPDELQLEMEDARPHHNVQCSPLPGPLKPCEHLFGSWGVRLAVWAVVLLSLLCNGLVLLSVFAGGPGPLPPDKFVVGAIAGANTLTGLSCGLLASVDALTFGRFAEYGAHWEVGLGCQATGFLAVLGSEASVLLLTLAAVHCSAAVSCVRARGKAPSPGSVRAGALGCLLLAGLAATLPLASIGEYGTSPLCLPYTPPNGQPTALGFAVALVMLNSFCFLVVAAAYVKLSCDLPRGDLEAVWDCTTVRHVAWLTFTDGLLYCPVAFLSSASALGLFPVTPEAIKAVLLVVLPLPACLNPLLYLLFSPRVREDLRWLRPCLGALGPLPYTAAGKLEQSSCDSTQALVAFSDVDLVLAAPEARQHPGLETYGLPAVTLASRRQPGGHFAEPEETRFGNWPLSMDGLLLGAEGAMPVGGGWSGGRGFSGSAFASHL